MAPANETAFLEAFDSSDIVRRATCRVIGMLKSQVGDANSSATLRIGGLFFSFSRSSSDDQNARSHDKPTTIPVPLKVTPVPFKVTPVPLNKKSEPFDKTLKKKEENLESSTWTTVRKQHKTKDSSKSNLPACGSSTLPKHASSTSTTSKNTSQHPRPQAKLFAVLKSSASTKITATSAKTSSSTKITSSSAKDAASSTLIPKSYVEVASTPVVALVSSSSTPPTTSDIAMTLPSITHVPQSSNEVVSPFNFAARSAGSNLTETTSASSDSMKTTSMPPQKIPSIADGVISQLELTSRSADLILTAPQEVPSIALEASFGTNMPLTDNERAQVQKGILISRKLYLEFPKNIQAQMVQIRFSKLLGPDDDELHTLLAMPNSDAFKQKPLNLGPALRELWLHPHLSITEKKGILSQLFFLSDDTND